MTQLLSRPRRLLGGTDGRLVWAVSLGHFTNDVFMSMGPVMLTFVAGQFMKIGAADLGFALSLRELVGSLSQPFFGWLTDRTGGRIQAPGGMVWTATLMLIAVFFGMTGSFGLMLVPYALAAVGSGAFHPVGVMHASSAKKSRSAGNTAYFFLAGQTGLALGPLLAGLLLDQAMRATDGHPTPASMSPLLALLLLVVPVALFMFFNMPSKRAFLAKHGTASGQDTGLWKMVGQIGNRTLLLLVVFIVLRSVVHLGTANFLPVVFASKGWQPGEYGGITSAFWLASAIAGVGFGWLADRYDRRRVIALSLITAAPLVALLPLVNGPLAILVAMAAGATAGGCFPVVVVLVQSLFPGSKGLVSGIVLGTIFATGALGNLIIGVMVERLGIAAAFGVVALISVMAVGIVLLLPARVSGRPAPQRMLAPVEATAGRATGD